MDSTEADVRLTVAHLVEANPTLDAEVIDCDPALADTAQFVEAYGYTLDQSANTLVVIGNLLIALIFGQEALLTALPCLLGGAILIFLPWFTLALIQKWRDRLEHQARSKGEAIHISGENQVKQ